MRIHLVLIAVLALACGETSKPSPDKDDDPSAKSAADETDEQPEPAADQGEDEGKSNEAAEAKAPRSGDGPTSIAACDEYLKKYEQCLQAKVPEEAREAMTEAFQAQRDAWVQSAEAAKGNEEIRAQLAKNCREALDAAKVPMEQYGCKW